MGKDIGKVVESDKVRVLVEVLEETVVEVVGKDIS